LTERSNGKSGELLREIIVRGRSIDTSVRSVDVSSSKAHPSSNASR
jgi:hypothetical protein